MRSPVLMWCLAALWVAFTAIYLAQYGSPDWHGNEIYSSLADRGIWYRLGTDNAAAWFTGSLGIITFLTKNWDNLATWPLILLVIGPVSEAMQGEIDQQTLMGSIKLFLYWCGLWAVIFVINFAVYFLIAAVLCAAFSIGLLALLTVKSGQALVTERGPLSAFLLSLLFAGGLTGAMVIGSAALFFFAYVFEAADSNQLFVAFSDLVAGDALWFFIKLAPLCYLSNRIYFARQDGGTAWLGVIPPLVAVLTFAIWPHFQDLLWVVQHPSWNAIVATIDAAVSYIVLPYELLRLSLQDPHLLSEWLNQQIADAGPSLFRLAHLYPTAFLLVATGMFASALFQPGNN